MLTSSKLLKNKKMTPFNEGQEERIMEAVLNRIEKYSDEAFDANFELVVYSAENREHIVRIGTSILCTKWGIGYPGGSFVQAIIDNDLTQTFGRADRINLNCIRFYVSLLYNQSYIA